MPKPHKLLLTVKEVAELLGVSPNTVRKLCDLGHLAGPHKIAGGAASKITWRSVKQYLKDLDRGTLPQRRPPAAD